MAIFSSTPRSPYMIICILCLYYCQSFLPNNNDYRPLMKLLLVPLLKHWGIYDTLLWVIKFCIFSILVFLAGIFNLGDTKMQSPHFTLPEPRKTQTLLPNQRISRVAGRTKIQSSVSNKVAIGDDEEDQISSDGLKETFDSRIAGGTEIQSSVSNKVAIGDDEEDHISSDGLKETSDSRIAERTKIQSSVSNKVAIGNDEEDQISSDGLKETFDSCPPRSFTFAELTLATNDFHEDRRLGAGGFGPVYKAVLPNGQTAAVKRVSSTSNQGIKEYKAEVTIISKSKHRHLVQLIGWCHEKKRDFLLVYELLENKSLDMHLFDLRMDSLLWSVRYKIAQGTAKAIRYLHEECGQHCVLHRDIKSSNVLLDSNFEPKLSDFGLAKLVDYGKSLELSNQAGTKGYIAPECAAEKKARTESDVYSYGVVALELVAGRKSIDYHVAEDQQVLVEWVQNLYKADKVMEAVDPRLGDDYDKLQAKGLLIVGLWCVLRDFRERPSMREIVCILNNTHDPLKDLHGKIPNLVPDPVPHPLDSILKTSSGFDCDNGNGKPRTWRRFVCF